MLQVMHCNGDPGANFTEHLFIVIEIRSKIVNVVFLICYLGNTWLQFFARAMATQLCGMC